MSKEIRQMIDKVKSYKRFVNEDVTDKKQFVVEQSMFKLLIDDVLVAETKFNIETPDEFFNEKYVSIYELETFEQFRGKGYAKYLLNEIFNYVKNTLKLNIITLIVDKDNAKAVSLYFNNGFEIFMEYEDSYSLVKKL
jgi:ribosomal protein S18 acetylase RimI-like enzyme